MRNLIDDILGSISRLQSKGCGKYPSGIFPSQRIHPFTGYSREDSNIFFSALIAFTLQQLRPALPGSSIKKIDTIIDRVVANYPDYRHPADPLTYNFWRDQPNGHFPNGLLLNHLPFMALPADTDDTSLIYLTSSPDIDLLQIKQKFESHYTAGSPVSSLTPPEYADLRAYPTFLGRKMKREFDVCVLCNVLYLVFKHNLPLSTVDLDSLEMIKRVLYRKDYRIHPFAVSPHYGNGTVILYHISRLISAFDPPELSGVTGLLIENLKEQLNHTESWMETLLLKTSLLRFRVNTPTEALPDNPLRLFKNFYFFQAGMLTGFQHASLSGITGLSYFHLKYRCQAYYWTLWLEYLVLQKSFSPAPPRLTSDLLR